MHSIKRPGKRIATKKERKVRSVVIPDVPTLDEVLTGIIVDQRKFLGKAKRPRFTFTAIAHDGDIHEPIRKEVSRQVPLGKKSLREALGVLGRIAWHSWVEGQKDETIQVVVFVKLSNGCNVRTITCDTGKELVKKAMARSKVRDAITLEYSCS
jgi:hypothetical protein